jgi:Ca2+-binding EF-hand superfamily protein
LAVFDWDQIGRIVLERLGTVVDYLESDGRGKELGEDEVETIIEELQTGFDIFG